MTMPATTTPNGDVMESVIAAGDLAKLTPDERVRYYTAVCKSLGLNTLTNPFSYIVLNGKLTLYATRACTDQLRKINGISLEIVSRNLADDILTVHVKARTPEGRVDEDMGAVTFSYPARFKDRDGQWKPHPQAGKPLQGDDRANAELKAVTKAKRRATLSICGLGWLDETEIEDIPANAKRTPPKAAPNVMLQPLPSYDIETGEIKPDDNMVDSDLVAAHMERCEAAAAKGWRALKDEWDSTPEAVADILRDAHLGRWKEIAKAAEVPA
jgi:hypothetical protein